MIKRTLSTQFLAINPPGKVLILLDGHTSHLSNPKTLDFALQNDIEFLWLPSHYTQYLQPVDRTFLNVPRYFSTEHLTIG